MLKLLRANFFRLWRDKVFYLMTALMLLAGAGLPIIHFLDRDANGGTAWTPDSSCFAYTYFIPVLLSAFSALYVGCEYSDATLRNKLIAGHGRAQVYLANAVVCVTAGALLSAAFLLPHTALGLLLLGAFRTDAATLLLYIVLNLMLSAAFAALFTLISMLCQSKAYSCVGCILLAFALLFAGIKIVSSLNEPEFYDAYSYTENGVTVSQEQEPNPNFLRGNKRKVYEFLHDFTPGGQALQLANMDAEQPALLALYDGIIVLAATGAGMIVFRRRDLK